MSEGLSLKKLDKANPAWLALPLVVFALITLTVGLVARQTCSTSYRHWVGRRCTSPVSHPSAAGPSSHRLWR
jgi:hypothetical protein